jgi:cobalt-zinc-cadmium efflux system outer membrane protein
VEGADDSECAKDALPYRLTLSMPSNLTSRGPIRFALAAACGLAINPLATAVAQQPVVVRQASLAQQPEAIPPPAAPGGQLAPSASPYPAQNPPPGAMGAPLTIPAQPQPPDGVAVLTLADLEQLALGNNPSLGVAQSRIAVARGIMLQVGLPPNFAWGYLGQQIGSGNRASQHALLIDGEVVTAGKLRWNRAIAEQEVIRAEQILFAQQQRVLTDVRIAFYEALLAQRSFDLAQQLLKIARDAQTTAQKLQRAGETSRIDLRQADIEVFNAENNLNDTRTRHTAAWQTLRAVLGIPQMAPTVLRGDIETIPDDLNYDNTLNRLWSISPEIAAAAANLDRARAALTRARLEPIPNVRFQGGVMQDQGINGKTDGIVQMLLPMPIINRNQGAIRAAEAEVAAAERAIRQVELDLQSRLAPVFQQYASAAYRVRRYRESILPAAEESLELARRGYAAGEFPFLNLLNAQRTFFQTNQQYLQSLLDLRTSTAEIEGLLLRNSLSTTPQ